mmetsp:Transcript_3368/g.5098  ORF Transcript_3368/g.5098 Transcript_3368/m.5098 type:complete len:876 (+) Transcript_3368:89-2716(+)|eukprot:CAMPEP_0184347566 /NCGR_PEP_ID=MMETSP1089-20130417/18764_1 /TAXON_ID=38269 ORGANISM="Gloeochaete wittrockiana, Strain SAG46.84" /NCGR_SAMPLE_ID=MMETSP1089 /ASSEMBLY_ACC=CAM_ASM_000445 /LENGTH=875 /DNA_ID=CAMNT_0026678697 /DNA_START=81 /DNA_END=2708 /DNA_ORIENTATION=-
MCLTAHAEAGSGVTGRVLLPTDVRPKTYRLDLQPNLETFIFNGIAEVDVTVVNATSTVTLHAVDLKISSIQLVTKHETLTPLSYALDEKKDTLSIVFKENLPLGDGTFKFVYTGTLNDQMAGFYRSKYTVDGQDRYLATTQFESTDARRAFPCWDEPCLKATFDVTLTVPSNRVAISNMPEVSSTVRTDGFRVIKFDTTPIMSTYLLAFVVGEFDLVEGNTPEGVHVRVFTPPGKKDQGLFALEVCIKSLSYFSQYFGIPYPLKKMDCIAIPDFAAGAMENWGLVTYREVAVLIDPVNSSTAMRQRVAEVVAHEMAHQWFGNLVTMEWWTHLWLNEGFATWAAYLAVDHIFPEWDMWTQFVTGNFSRALTLDGLKSSHPIEVEVKNSGEISEIFDAISYSKGASVIRMLASYLGYETFKQGLNVYLKRFTYRNAVTEDLWQALSDVSGQPIVTMMNSWIKQTGYPVLTVEEVATANAKVRTLSVSQTRFLSNGQASDEDKQTVWWVPVGIATQDKAEPVYSIVHEPTGTFSVPSQQCLKVNAGQSGVYRVKYSQALLAALFPAIEALQLPPADRLGVEIDVFALAKAGLQPTSQLLSLLQVFKNETDYTVWSEINICLDEIANLIGTEDYFDAFERFARDLLRPAYKRIGWDAKPGDSHSTLLLRTLLLSSLGHFGDEEVVGEARRRLAVFLDDRTSLVPDLRSLVYSTVVAHGGEEDFNNVLRVFRETTLHEERLRCLRALGYTRKPDLIDRVLKFCMSDEVRSQDTYLVLAIVGSNRHGRASAWSFLQERWNDFFERFGKGGFTLLSSIISSCTKNFSSADKATEIESFFATHPVDSSKRTIQQSLERIRMNANWLARDGAGIKTWLSSHGYA